MVKSKRKIILSSILLVVFIFAAVPKVYIHSLLGHTHHSQKAVSSETSVNSDENTKDCDVEKFDTPVYFTVFKFILNFLPLKDSKKTTFNTQESKIQKVYNKNSPLRGPPVA